MSTTQSPSKLVHLVYFSKASKPFGADELRLLLRKAREQNARLGVTGMLLYSEGKFLQILEGTDSTIKELMAKIERDPRHCSMSRLGVRPVEKREFSEWSMAFRDLSGRAERGLSEFLNSDFDDEEFQKRSELTYRLILQFKADHCEAQNETLVSA